LAILDVAYGRLFAKVVAIAAAASITITNTLHITTDRQLDVLYVNVGW